MEGKIENEGCFCEDGLVENHNGDCVPSAECPGENIITIIRLMTLILHLLSNKRLQLHIMLYNSRIQNGGVIGIVAQKVVVEDSKYEMAKLAERR